MWPMTIRAAYRSWPGAHRRGAVIQRVFAHDVSHITELNEALGAAGLPQIDLWN